MSLRLIFTDIVCQVPCLSTLFTDLMLLMLWSLSTIQKVAGCAARYAETCGTSLLNRVNQVMIKLASKGCGEPDVSE